MVFAGFIDNNIIEGDIKSNPFVYASHDVVSFEYLKNGVPFRTYEPDYDNDDFLDVYFAFLNAIGCGQGDIDVGLTVSSHVSHMTSKLKIKNDYVTIFIRYSLLRSSPTYVCTVT